MSVNQEMQQESSPVGAHQPEAMAVAVAGLSRCSWCGSDPLYVAYHDEEWGVPVHDDTKHFEFLVLEGAQAGLSWYTILKKREGYRRAFANWDVQAVARFSEADCERLMLDTGIVRNRLKIRGAVKSAQAFLRVQEEFGSFDAYIWRFVDSSTLPQSRSDSSQVPGKTPQSDAMSKDLLKRGFKFVGSTICYAYMQAAGLVNDHITTCFRYSQCQALPRHTNN